MSHSPVRASQMRARSRGMDAVNPRAKNNRIPQIREAIRRLSDRWRERNPDVDVRRRVATKYALDISLTGHEGPVDPIVRRKVHELCQTSFALAYLKDPSSTEGRFFKAEVKHVLELGDTSRKTDGNGRLIPDHKARKGDRDVNDFMFAFREIYNRLNRPRK